MKRKLIKQGGTGLTFYVPKKWIDKKGLKPGDEIEITEIKDNLLLSATEIEKEQMTITLEIKKSRESSIRTLLVNAYRAGFDKITAHFPGNIKIINKIIDNHLIGFEIFKKNKDIFLLESVSEPNYDNFKNMMHKQLYLISEILSNIVNPEISLLVNKVQRYDNFLKRCISKKFFSQPGAEFLWQFLSHINQISRLCLHFHTHLIKKKLKLSKDADGMIHEIQYMFDVLKTAYLKHEAHALHKLHETEQLIVYEQGPKLLKKKDPFVICHIMMIAKQIYLANSPLTGFIEMKSFKERSNEDTL